MAGCASKLAFIEYYPSVTDAEQSAGHGAVKVIDYRKPTGIVSIFRLPQRECSLLMKK